MFCTDVYKSKINNIFKFTALTFIFIYLSACENQVMKTLWVNNSDENDYNYVAIFHGHANMITGSDEIACYLKRYMQDPL